MSSVILWRWKDAYFSKDSLDFMYSRCLAPCMAFSPFVVNRKLECNHFNLPFPLSLRPSVALGNGSMHLNVTTFFQYNTHQIFDEIEKLCSRQFQLLPYCLCCKHYYCSYQNCFKQFSVFKLVLKARKRNMYFFYIFMWI